MDEAVLIGAGAIGTVLADALATAGLSVAVLGGTPVDRLVLQDGAARREHPVTHLPAWDGRERRGPLVVAVKAHQTAAAGPLIATAAAGASAVVVAQNGIEHAERVAPYAGTTPVVPLLLYTPAERTGPGRAVLRRPAPPDAVAPAEDAGVAALLRAGGLRVETAADFRTAAWRKLLTNVASMSATTLAARDAAVFREPGPAAFALALVAEAAEAARADGAAIDVDEPARILRWLQDLPDGTRTSMEQDRAAGRPLEQDAVHGAALRAADRAGLSAPLLRAVTTLLAAIRPDDGPAPDRRTDTPR